MAAKGTEAKQRVEQKIAEAFGNNLVGIYDKKIYVWSEENGEKVQVAIALTCPKVPVGAVRQSEDINFDSPEIATAAPTTFQPAEFTQEEKDTVAKLMAELGL